MGGKYSAEWWEKVARTHQEYQLQRASSTIVDNLVASNSRARPDTADVTDTGGPVHLAARRTVRAAQRSNRAG